MRLASVLLAATAACCLASNSSAQLTVIPGGPTGCSDGSTIGPATTLIGAAEIPASPATNQIAMQTPCGVGTAAFLFWGLADMAGPGAPGAFNWPLANPCFAGFANPPAFCNGILNPVAGDLSGGIADATGNVTVNWPFLLTDIRPVLDLQAVFAGTAVVGFGPVSFQLLCVDLGTGNCLSVSQAYTLALSYVP